MYMSDYPTAIRLYKQVLNTCEQILEPSHRDILSTRNDLAYAYYWGDHTDEAIDLFKQVLDDRTRILSGDHEDTLMTATLPSHTRTTASLSAPSLWASRSSRTVTES